MASFEIRDDALIRKELDGTCEGGIPYFKRTIVITKEEFIACYKSWIESEDKNETNDKSNRRGPYGYF